MGTLFNINKFRHSLERMRMDWSIGPSYAWLDARRLAAQSLHTIDDPRVVALNRKRIHRLIKWGLTEFAVPLSRWRDTRETATPLPPDDKGTIWMVWLQGVDHIPAKYHPFIESVYRCNRGRTIRILDEQAIKSLIDIPEVIAERYRCGDISPVLFTDYVRFALLERYGGIWMDLTLFQLHEPSIDVLDYPTWCIKGLAPFPYDTAIPDATQWQSYYVAAQPHALFCKVVLDLFEYYFSRHTMAFDYFFIYYLAYFARTIQPVCQSYDLIPPNNTRCEEFLQIVDSHEDLTPELIASRLFRGDTWIYKASSHLSEEQSIRCNAILPILEAKQHTSSERQEELS